MPANPDGSSNQLPHQLPNSLVFIAGGHNRAEHLPHKIRAAEKLKKATDGTGWFLFTQRCNSSRFSGNSIKGVNPPFGAINCRIKLPELCDESGIFKNSD